MKTGLAQCDNTERVPNQSRLWSRQPMANTDCKCSMSWAQYGGFPVGLHFDSYLNHPHNTPAKNSSTKHGGFR
jgi:hypothetical protein